jgi:hypothetical protein
MLIRVRIKKIVKGQRVQIQIAQRAPTVRSQVIVVLVEMQARLVMFSRTQHSLATC